jgi:putative ABC transport system permease protein
MIRAIVLRLGMKANDMKLLSALIVAMALCIPVLHAKWKASKEYKEIEEDDPVSDGTPMKGEVD